MGYLGKISAVVSVNTGDFASKLNRCKSDVESFAGTVSSALRQSASASSKHFGSIYTDVQKLERALKAASTQKLDFSGMKMFKGKDIEQAAEQMRQIQSVAAQLSAPLSKAVASVDAMADSIKTRLHGAMVQAQADVEAIQDAVKNTGSVTAAEFSAAEARVRKFAAAAKMATEASQAASSMAGGKGFQFQQPKLAASMRAGGDLFKQVSNLPAERMTGELVKLLNAQKQNAGTAAAMSAQYTASPTLANKKALDEASVALDGVNNRIREIIKSYADMDAAAAAAAASMAEAAAKQLEDEKRLWAIRDADQAAFAKKQAAAARAIYDEEQAAIARERAAREEAIAVAAADEKRLWAIRDADQAAFAQKQAAYARAIHDEEQAAIARERAAREAAAAAALADEKRLWAIRDADQAAFAKRQAAAAKAINDEEQSAIAREKAERDAAAMAAAAKSKEIAAALLRLEQNRLQVTTGQVQSVSQLASEYSGVLSRVERLSAAQRTSAAATISANAGKIESAISSGDDSKVAGVRAEMAAIEGAVSAAEDLDAQQKAAKKSADNLRDSLSQIADSIGKPAAPIDQAKEAIDRLNSAIDKMKNPAQKASAEARAAKIRKDIEQEVAISGATGNAPASGVILGAAARAGRLADAVDAINNAPKKKSATDLFGESIGSSARNADNLKAKVVSLQSEFEKLPTKTQSSLAKAMNNLRNDVASLDGNASTSQIKKVTSEYRNLLRLVERLNASSNFKGTFDSFLKDSSVKYYTAQLQAVQTQMAAIGVTAKGPVADAIRVYRKELSAAAKAGTLDNEKVRASLKQRVKDIGDAAVQEKKMTAAQSKAFVGGVMRTGDVGRMGTDKFSLGLTQAAFAIDDFMSATGGVEQKIRAVSNNLSQLGFILGGTAGLFAAIGVTFAAQATIAIYKFATGGKSAEDRAKALNDAIAKQKTLVEELAQAYGGLAKEMSLSAGAQRGAAAASSLGTVGAANRTNRMERLTGVSQAVVEERAMQAAINRLVAAVTSVGVMIAKQQQLRLSQTREFVESARARNAGPVDPARLDMLRGERRAIAESLNRSSGPRMAEILGLPLTSTARKMAERLADVEAAIRSAEDAIVAAADSAAYAIVAGSTEGRERIAYAQNQLADAIAAGVPGVLKFQGELDRLSIDMGAAMTALIAAAKEESPEKRKKLTEQAQADMAAVNQRAAAAVGEANRFREQSAFRGPSAADVLSQLGNSGQSRARSLLTGAINRGAAARGALEIQDANVAQSAAEVARVKSESAARVREAGNAADEAWNNFKFIERQVQAGKLKASEATKAQALYEGAVDAEKREKVAADNENAAAQANMAAAEAARAGAAADVDAAQAAERLAAAAGQAALAMEQFLARTNKIAEGGVSASEQAADLAQKRLTERPTEENRARRDAAEKELIFDRARAANLKAQLEAAQERAAMDPVVLEAQRVIDQRQEDIDNEMRAATAEGRAPKLGATPAMMANDRAFLERRIFDLTKPQREAMDQFAQQQSRELVAAQEADPAFGREFRAAERARVRQGREDAMTVRERQQIEASRAAENMAAAAAMFTNPKDRLAFAQKYYDNKKREILQGGPLGQAADERFNAMMTTRRIGMEATDITTAEGSRELNRLLRGDDANKDVNFAEMQRQTELLADIRDGIRENTGLAVIDTP